MKQYDKETLESIRMVMEFAERVPDIPIDERGIKYTSECTCGGIIHAERSKYNGHLWAGCDKCGMKIIE